MKRKRILSLFMLLAAIFMIPARNLSAAPIQKSIEQADILLDTSDPDIGVAIFIDSPAKIRAYNRTELTHSGYFYLKSNKDKLADFDCTGYFSYDKTICNVTDVKTSVWNTADGWKVDVDESTKQISPSYARATGVFKLYKVGIFSDTLTSSATINIFCNQKGNTSSEFNGDK